MQTGLFINNDFVPSLNGSTLRAHNPYSGTVLGTVSAAEEVDVDKAVVAAESCFRTSWKKTPGSQRGALLHKLASLLERDIEQLATIHALNAGIVYDNAKLFDIPIAISVLRHFAGWADKITGRVAELQHGVGYVHREPLGVCGMIVPWNGPL